MVPATRSFSEGGTKTTLFVPPAKIIILLFSVIMTPFVFIMLESKHMIGGK